MERERAHEKDQEGVEDRKLMSRDSDGDGAAAATLVVGREFEEGSVDCNVY